MADRKLIAVVGAGPKAAALAAWVAAWERVQRASPGLNLGEQLSPSPMILVFEGQPSSAASWVGGSGYSDGTPEVCSPLEPDVTVGAGSWLPVSAPSYSAVAAVFRRELRAFSWGALMPLIPTPPSHQTFGTYLDKVLRMAAVPAGPVELNFSEEVIGIEPTAVGQWRVETGSGRVIDVDGVVVTGPGPSRSQIRGSDALTVRDRYRDAISYWLPTGTIVRQKQIHDWLLANVEDESSPHVVIVGAGGAASAIAADICRLTNSAWAALGVADDEGFQLRITFVAPQAGLFTRGESQWETRTLLDAELWEHLSADLRRQVNAQLVSGVTFRRVLQELEKWTTGASRMPTSMEVEPGRLLWVDDGTALDTDLPPVDAPLRVVVNRSSGGLVVHGAHLVINAVGFDNRWFLDSSRGFLSPPGLSALLNGVDIPDALDESLAVDIGVTQAGSGRRSGINCLQRLHLPMLSGGSQPPGLGSLLNIGHLADRILSRYLP